MKKFFGLMFVILLFAGICFAEESKSHTVVDGDTLWDLAGEYYQDPWLWEKIHDANVGVIDDPHWIFPEQTIKIPGISEPVVKTEEKPVAEPEPEEVVEEEIIVESEPVEEVVEEEVVEEVEEEIEEEVEAEEAEEEKVVVRKKKKDKYFSARGIIVPEDWKEDGYVIGDKEKNLMISAGDTVYLNIGNNLIKPGDQCKIYRMIDRVRDPNERRYIGYELHEIGKVEVTKSVGEKTCSAKVTISYEPLQVGDLVKINTEE